MKTLKIAVAILAAASLSACASSSISDKDHVAQRQMECKAEGGEYRRVGNIMRCVDKSLWVVSEGLDDVLRANK